MIRLSEIVLRDALTQGNQCYRTIKDITCGELLTQDRYGAVYSAKHEGKNVLLKIMLEPQSERAVNLQATIETIQKLDLPFIASASIHRSELSVITLDNKQHQADIIMIDDSGSSVIAYLDEEDGEDIIDSFISLIGEITRRGYIFDLISIDAFRYSPERGLHISPVENFVFDGIVSTDKLASRAFSNFLIMSLLQFIIEVNNSSTNQRSDCAIEYKRHPERFDLRRLDYFLSGEYITDILTLIDTISQESDFKCESLRETLTAANLESKLSILGTASFDDGRYTVIGNHSENRILVREIATGKLGYFDFAWKQVIDCQYDDANNFIEGMSVCIRDDVYGVINRDGEIVVPFEYDYIEWNSKANLFYWRKNGGELMTTARCNFL